MLAGSLFTQDYLLEGIKASEAWKALDDASLASFRGIIAHALGQLLKVKKPNEAETEKALVWPVLEALGWNESLPQQNLSFKGRERVPDGLLFADPDAKAKASAEAGASRFRHGQCIMEAKRWNRALDKTDSKDDDTGNPSSQMLGYLRRVDDVTRGKLRWGILTNGRLWRLYFQGADSVSEDYLEIDLAGIFSLPDYRADLFGIKIDADHALKLFLLLFGRPAFIPQDHGRTLHALVRDQGKQWEAKVAADLSQLVFNEVFPKLVEALAKHDPKADKQLGPSYLSEVRQAALIFLYRMLFILYAEDRNLLPDENGPYKDFALSSFRLEIGKKKGAKDAFSSRSTLYWSRLKQVFRSISEGDDALGIPPYNGGLFMDSAAPVLLSAELPDDVLAELIFALSYDQTGERPKYINYRDLSVQQLGSIYERLLEYDLAVDGKVIVIRLNAFARKGSGSYYTPEPLVKLIIERTVGPLIDERLTAFRAKAEELAQSKKPLKARLAELAEFDPASRILDLKICDPAMGSGHFLVSLVDWLADHVLAAMEWSTDAASWNGKKEFESPLAGRIEKIRKRIEQRAKEHKWPLPEKQLDDRNIIRRMILKRCIYGVDLNPMAVELAKVALWLHTFTVGAPLSFLDHHLRCGNSLFGEHVRGALDWLEERGPLLISGELKKAQAVRAGMEEIEALTDADIAEAKESAESFAEVESGTQPVENLLDFIHVLRWHDPRDRATHAKVAAFLDAQFGDPLEILNGKPAKDKEFEKLLAGWRAQISEQRFLHWEIAFPGVWSNWESAEPSGGFDAVIGNPPWDRIKFQEVEWFEAHKPEIARIETKALRQKEIAKLKKAGEPLFAEYEKAANRAETMSHVARSNGDYPYLSSGDINLNSLFIERGHQLVKPEGLVGLLTPSGIASDQSSSEFFRKICDENRLESVIDFFNKKYDGELFFPDVYYRFKFCTYIAGGISRKFGDPKFAFYVRDLSEIENPNRFFPISPSLMRSLDPENGTAPVFQNLKDMKITTSAYQSSTSLSRLRQGQGKQRDWVWPIKYVRMLDMANDSKLFETPASLAKDGAYSVAGGAWKKGAQVYAPLYEGKMVQAFDHRASDIVSVADNVFRTGQGSDLSESDHSNPDRFPKPRYYVDTSDFDWPSPVEWCIALKDVTSVTNARSIIAALIPKVAAGHTLPLIASQELTSTVEIEGQSIGYKDFGPIVLANLNAIVLDYLARQKINSNHVAWFMLQQLPFAPPSAYTRKFGSKSAASIVKEDVLALTYTAHDMVPFARDMRYTGKPFQWDETDRARRRARLDALYFMLYFPTKTKEEIAALRETAEYIFSTFPIVEREDMATHGRYLSRDLCLAYINALAAGDADAKIVL